MDISALVVVSCSSLSLTELPTSKEGSPLFSSTFAACQKGWWLPLAQHFGMEQTSPFSWLTSDCRSSSLSVISVTVSTSNRSRSRDLDERRCRTGGGELESDEYSNGEESGDGLLFGGLPGPRPLFPRPRPLPLPRPRPVPRRALPRERSAGAGSSSLLPGSSKTLLTSRSWPSLASSSSSSSLPSSLPTSSPSPSSPSSSRSSPPSSST
mmetsp:Transcript_16296/g.63530  ORF Transcript_16296/g.63530 Transcript_16296/m.63530 type:complete len:210 (-) Transcript_16296:434-1063(-)